MPKRNIVYSLKLSGLVLVLITIIYIVLPNQQESNNKLILSTIELRVKLINQLTIKDAEQVYAEIKNIYSASEFKTQYNALYIFGQELYSSKGLQGIKVCDESYGFACLHGAFSIAVKDNQEQTIDKLNQICLQKYNDNYSPCQHGIGMAIYQQYGKNDIEQALSLCEKMQTNPLLGCSSGVFTEHNFPKSTQLFEQFTFRPLGENIYGPCQDITSKFRRSCYYELGNLWMTSFGVTSDIYKSICSDIKNGEEKKACLKGLGRSESRFSYYQIPQTQYFCRNLDDEQRTLSCLSGAVWGFLSQKEFHNSAYSLCDQIANKNICLSEGDLRNEKW